MCSVEHQRACCGVAGKCYTVLIHTTVAVVKERANVRKVGGTQAAQSATAGWGMQEQHTRRRREPPGRVVSIDQSAAPRLANPACGRVAQRLGFSGLEILSRTSKGVCIVQHTEEYNMAATTHFGAANPGQHASTRSTVRAGASWRAERGVCKTERRQCARKFDKGAAHLRGWRMCC